jgi:hypothetical protein
MKNDNFLIYEKEPFQFDKIIKECTRYRRCCKTWDKMHHIFDPESEHSVNGGSRIKIEERAKAIIQFKEQPDRGIHFNNFEPLFGAHHQEKDQIESVKTQ